MDAYNLLQEQLASINNNINNGLSKLQDDIRLLSRRIDQLESNDHGLNEQVDAIRHSTDLLPKIYTNQVGLLETLLIGNQYQFRRLSNIVSRDSENPPYTDSTGFHNNPNPNSLSLGSSLAQNDAVVTDGTNDQVNVSGNSNQRINVQNGNANDAASGTLGINPSNSVNNPNNLHQDNSHQQVLRSSDRINNVNLGLIAPTNQNQLGSRRSNNSIASLRNFTSILPIDNEPNVLPITPQSHPSASQDDGSNILGDVQGADDDNSRRIWENVTFNRLNPNPKTVQEVLDEYYYGYQGQPPLKYLEDHRKEWRKGNKNLSKTFCRRYRIITAVEVGTRLYAREYGTNENLSRDRTVTELENLRIKENGRKETMYWLFHHVPNHLKRR